MFDIHKAIRNNKLFKDFNFQEINHFLVSSQFYSTDYHANQVIAIESEPLNRIGLILDGTVEIYKMFPSGKKIVINHLSTGDVFGEVMIFSAQNIFPSTIISESKSKVMFINKANILKICYQNEKFLQNFLQLLSEKILSLDNRLQFLSRDTIRQKICLYLLECYHKQKTNCLFIPISREKMAELFGVTRPSLSRELSKMKEEGLLEIRRHTITLKDLTLLDHHAHLQTRKDLLF